MSLKDIHIEQEYRNLKCDVIHDFYIPVLSNACVYKRAVGFFNSGALYEMSIGLNNLVKNNGKIELIVSPNLTKEDVESIRLGYKTRDEIIANAILRDFNEPRKESERKKLNLLANLIADGNLDIKVAFKINKNEAGIFHEKVGIMIDAEGNRVAFTGSMNETYSGLLLNYEAIDVFCSWNEGDEQRVEKKEFAFDNLWSNLDDTMDVIPFPDVAIERIKNYKVEKTEELLSSEEINNQEKPDEFFKIPADVNLFDYQKDAIKAWVDHDYNGIFDMATGAGKTYTALGALSKLSSDQNGRLAVIIVCPYQHLVEQWAEDIEKFNVKPIIAYSTSSQRKWKEYFEDSVNQFKAKVINNFCIVTTNGTFSTDFFQKILKKLRKDVCFVVDEAHNFGAEKIRRLLPENIKWRLALSATFERHRDKEGTDVLKDYFGEVCIKFTLEQAIKGGFLTPYYYYPVVVNLTADEYENYAELTKKIAHLGGASEENCEKNPMIELLLLKRARIVAGAHNKIDKLLEIIEPFKNDNHMLVYCGATKYDRADIDDSDDVRQIEMICKLLQSKLSIKVRKFTAEENKDARQQIKEDFKIGRDLQVVAAIKCLDEGMNIPAINRAFILASSTNPKEYIQRRGRVLRKAEGKKYAEIFDFITLPRPLEQASRCSVEELKCDLSLLRKEFVRMMDFADNSRNPWSVDNLKKEILSKYGLYEINMEDVYND